MNNKSKLLLTILFFRKGKSYYYKYNGKIYKLNMININNLKENLITPYKIVFYAMSKAQIGRVIVDLLDESTDVKLKRINSEKENFIKYEAIFSQEKNNKKLLLKK